MIHSILSYQFWRYWFTQFYLTHYDVNDSLNFILPIMSLLIY